MPRKRARNTKRKAAQSKKARTKTPSPSKRGEQNNATVVEPSSSTSELEPSSTSSAPINNDNSNVMDSSRFMDDGKVVEMNIDIEPEGNIDEDVFSGLGGDFSEETPPLAIPPNYIKKEDLSPINQQSTDAHDYDSDCTIVLVLSPPESSLPTSQIKIETESFSTSMTDRSEVLNNAQNIDFTNKLLSTNSHSEVNHQMPSNDFAENNFCPGINPTNFLSSIPANLKNITNDSQLLESSNSCIKQESSLTILNDSSVKDNAAVSVSENIDSETQSVSNINNSRLLSLASNNDNSNMREKTPELPTSRNILRNNEDEIVTAAADKISSKTVNNNYSPVIVEAPNQPNLDAIQTMGDCSNDRVVPEESMNNGSKIKKETSVLSASNTSLKKNDKKNEMINAISDINPGTVSITHSPLIEMSNQQNFAVSNEEALQSTNIPEESTHSSIDCQATDVTNVDNEITSNTSNAEQQQPDMQKTSSLDNDTSTPLPSLIPYESEFIETAAEENSPINITGLSPVWKLQRVGFPFESVCAEELALHLKLLGYKKRRVNCDDLCKAYMRERCIISQPNIANSNVQIRSENQSTLNLQTNQLVVDNIAIKNELSKVSATKQVISKIESEEVIDNITNVEDSHVNNTSAEQNLRNRCLGFTANLDSSEMQKSKVDENSLERTSNIITPAETTNSLELNDNLYSSDFVYIPPSVATPPIITNTPIFSNVPVFSNSPVFSNLSVITNAPVITTAPIVTDTFSDIAKNLTTKVLKNIMQTALQGTSDTNFVADKSNDQHFPENSYDRQNFPKNSYDRQNFPENLNGQQNFPENLNGQQNFPENLNGQQNFPEHLNDHQENFDDDSDGMQNDNFDGDFQSDDSDAVVKNNENDVSLSNDSSAMEISPEKRASDTPVEKEAEFIPRKKSRYELIMERHLREKELANNSSRNETVESCDKIRKPNEITNKKKVAILHSASKVKITDKNELSKHAQDIAKKVNNSQKESTNLGKESTNLGKETDVLKDKNENSRVESIFSDMGSSKEMRFKNRNSVLFKDMTKDANKRPKPAPGRQRHPSQKSQNQLSMEDFHAQVDITDDITVPVPKSKKVSVQDYLSRQASNQPSSNRNIANQTSSPVLPHSLQTSNSAPIDPRLRKYGPMALQNTPTMSNIRKPELSYISPYQLEMPADSRNKTLLSTPVNSNQPISAISWNNFSSSRNQRISTPSVNTSPPPLSPDISDSSDFIAPGNRNIRNYPTVFQHPSHSPAQSSHLRDPRNSPISPFSSPSPSRDNDPPHRKNSTDSYEVSLLPTELSNSIGKRVISSTDALMLILSWVPNWLKEVDLPSNQNSPPPVCGNTNFPLKEINVKFGSAVEHFNTFFPLMLHDLFFRVNEMLKDYTKQGAKKWVLNINKISRVGDMVEVEAKTICSKKMSIPSEGQIGIVTFALTSGYHRDAFVYVSDVKISRETDGSNHEVMYVYLKTMFGLATVDKKQEITLIAFFPLKVLNQIKSLSLLDELSIRDIILNPSEPRCIKVTLKRLGAVHTSINIINSGVEEIKESLAIEQADEARIVIVDSPLGTDYMSTLIALIENTKMCEKETGKRKILVCTRTMKQLENVGLRLLSAATASDGSDSAINTVILSKPAKLQQPELKKLALEEQVRNYMEKKKSTLPSKLSPIENDDLRTEAHKFVLENCDVILSSLVLCYEPVVDSILGMQGSSHFSFCIIDEAYTCTEPECFLPFLYGIKKLALVGDSWGKPRYICRQITKYNYYRSLVERLRAVIDCQ